MTLKLYTVVRNDLDHGAQAAQSAHALAALALKHTIDFKNWDNQTIVLLKTQHPGQLAKLIESAQDGGFKHATFTEPDYLWYRDSLDVWHQRSNVVTAAAFIPNWTVQNVLLADLPLALSEPPKKKGWFNW